MADIIAFPSRPADEPRYREEKAIDAESGIVVRILSRVDDSCDLIVVLDGTFEGSTTVATFPAGDIALAEVVAHSILATLEAAEITWSLDKAALRG